GRSCARPRQMESWAASGSLRTQADDERAQEVGRSRITVEVSEQCWATGGGGGGGKGAGQREAAPAKRAPDPGPARRGNDGFAFLPLQFFPRRERSLRCWLGLLGCIFGCLRGGQIESQRAFSR